METTNMEWRTPPVTKNGSPGQVRKFVETLKANPGEFAVYCEKNSSKTGHSKAQQYKKRYPGTEWLVRKEDDGYTVFGRWIA